MTDGLLFDPNTYDPQQFDAGNPAAAARDHRLVRGPGQEAHPRRRPDRAVARRLRRLRQAREAVRDVPDAVGIRRRQSEQALGRRPQRRAVRDPRVLRADLLVHRAGHHPRARADLAEREQGRQAQGRRRPRGRRGDGVRVVRARARRRRLQHRHGAHAGQRGGPRQRHPVPGDGGEVLHRQRQRRQHGVGVRPPRRHRGSATRTSSSPPTAGTRTTT